ncbi:hypothetical protein BZA05DRAFT_214364 [Tricharina praecox]|uniref:uncharacterized protein n=1 Tax=Tricharina praecox TaxID=43433 RepID=UPI0022211124|nr:uncharacterized protein BZA05DRAFT_214364 [Tricharina praecox]KAI5855655.1 hypothetical protein BZA05DRAFT_214364 [Tricharina praecox]
MEGWLESRLKGWNSEGWKVGTFNYFFSTFFTFLTFPVPVPALSAYRFPTLHYFPALSVCLSVCLPTPPPRHETATVCTVCWGPQQRSPGQAGLDQKASNIQRNIQLPKIQTASTQYVVRYSMSSRSLVVSTPLILKSPGRWGEDIKVLSLNLNQPDEKCEEQKKDEQTRSKSKASR